MSVEPYDFRKPARLASELEQRVAAWLRAGCALVPEKWAADLPVRVELCLEGMETARPADALGALPDAAVAYRIGVAAHEMTTLFVVPRPLVLALVGGMLGDACAELPPDRAVSPVEESLYELLVQRLLAALREAWPGDESPALRLEQVEPAPSRTRIFGRDDHVVVCRFAARGPFGEADCRWLIPQAGVIRQFSQSDTAPAPSQEANVRPRLEAIVREIPLEVTVRLGAAELEVSDLSRLRAGDLVLLDQPVSEPLEACVASEPRFRVSAGRLGAKQACQIEAFVEN